MIPIKNTDYIAVYKIIDLHVYNNDLVSIVSELKSRLFKHYQSFSLVYLIVTIYKVVGFL